MAHAPTTPLQVILQVGAGVGCAAVLYNFLAKKPQLQPPADELEEQLKALDREAQVTSGRLWGLEHPSKRVSGATQQDQTEEAKRKS